jgi:hypothetical protein
MPKFYIPLSDGQRYFYVRDTQLAPPDEDTLLKEQGIKPSQDYLKERAQQFQRDMTNQRLGQTQEGTTLQRTTDNKAVFRVTAPGQERGAVKTNTSLTPVPSARPPRQPLI